MSEENLIASDMSISPKLAFLAFWYLRPPYVHVPVSSIFLSALIAPACRAASAVTGLNTEPVGYADSYARSSSGALVESDVRKLQTFCENGWAKMLASKPGCEPIARIAPVVGSIAT